MRLRAQSGSLVPLATPSSINSLIHQLRHPPTPPSINTVIHRRRHPERRLSRQLRERWSRRACPELVEGIPVFVLFCLRGRVYRLRKKGGLPLLAEGPGLKLFESI